MRKFYTLLLLAAIAMPAITFRASGQTLYTKNVLVGNSGKFEFMPPYTDFVTLTRFDPAQQTTAPFGPIGTQSVQDILVHGHFAYVAAQDSVLKIDLNTWTRVAAVADSGLNKLVLYNDRLVISKQYPVTTYFVEVLDTADLSLVAHVANIPGECGGITVMNDKVYVAVNGGWMGTEGKLAWVSTTDWTLSGIANFGTEAVGIFNLFAYNNKIITVNKTPYGAPATGSITEFDPATSTHTNSVIPVTVGSASGLKDSLLFLKMDAGLGIFNLNSKQIVNPTVIPDPGAAQFISIISAGIDAVAGRIYANIGDYTTSGYCLVTNLDGDSITSFATGISSECIAFDHRSYPVGIAAPDAESLTLYPNPATESVVLEPGTVEPGTVTLMNSSGKILLSTRVAGGTARSLIPVSQYPAGIYLVRWQSANTCQTARFVKR